MKNRIKEVLLNLKEKELLDIWNKYSDSSSSSQHIRIYKTEEFNDVFKNREPIKIAMNIYSSDFNPNDPYFKINPIDNLESDLWLLNLINLDDLVNYIEINNISFNNNNIKEILEGKNE